MIELMPILGDVLGMLTGSIAEVCYSLVGRAETADLVSGSPFSNYGVHTSGLSLTTYYCCTLQNIQPFLENSLLIVMTWLGTRCNWGDPRAGSSRCLLLQEWSDQSLVFSLKKVFTSILLDDAQIRIIYRAIDYSNSMCFFQYFTWQLSFLSWNPWSIIIQNDGIFDYYGSLRQFKAMQYRLLLDEFRHRTDGAHKISLFSDLVKVLYL